MLNLSKNIIHVSLWSRWHYKIPQFPLPVHLNRSQRVRNHVSIMKKLKCITQLQLNVNLIMRPRSFTLELNQDRTGFQNDVSSASNTLKTFVECSWGFFPSERCKNTRLKHVCNWVFGQRWEQWQDLWINALIHLPVYTLKQNSKKNDFYVQYVCATRSNDYLFRILVAIDDINLFKMSKSASS